MNNWLSYNI